LVIKSVGKAAMDMVQEVRRQFKEIPWLLEWKEWAEADYEKCVSISTKAAVREMILPGALTIITPIVVGFIGWGSVLGWYLVGVTVCGVLMAIFQSNAGWAWDNAKKSIEAGITINWKLHEKWSLLHKNAVVGDTVGDPLKDTSGPSLNILIKLTCIVALIIASMI
jgi:K(+)-stimulated pyrophosphate-energized sodium pump